MQVNKVAVSRSYLINLGNYENQKYEVLLEAELTEQEASNPNNVDLCINQLNLTANLHLWGMMQPALNQWTRDQARERLGIPTEMVVKWDEPEESATELLKDDGPEIPF